MQISLIAKPGNSDTGVGRYVRTLRETLGASGLDARLVTPTLPPPLAAGQLVFRRAGYDLRSFFANYPIWATYPEADVYHITSQNLATLMLIRRPPGRVVVTVHDIIPYMLRGDPELCSYRTAADRLFDKLAMRGLKRADLLIAVSRYTKRCLTEHIGIEPDRIWVVYPAVDHGRYRPLAVPDSIRERYRLPEGRRYLIYVGSEDPRKNVATLIRALAQVRRTMPDVELIKVGRAHFTQERERWLSLADDLGIASAIRILDDVPEADLPLLYNLVDVCAMPSLYEGFGFPVLEAMACGTPVVYSAAASLPELAGDAGVGLDLSHEPVSRLADAILSVLTDDELRGELRDRGLAQAAAFRWTETARKTIGIYARAASQRVSGRSSAAASSPRLPGSGQT